MSKRRWGCVLSPVIVVLIAIVVGLIVGGSPENFAMTMTVTAVVGMVIVGFGWLAYGAGRGGHHTGRAARRFVDRDRG